MFALLSVYYLLNTNIFAKLSQLGKICTMRCFNYLTVHVFLTKENLIDWEPAAETIITLSSRLKFPIS